MAAFVFFALVLLIFIAFQAHSKKGPHSGKTRGDSFSDELYKYAVNSKGKLRNPHMSRRAMKYRLMKRR